MARLLVTAFLEYNNLSHIHVLHLFCLRTSTSSDYADTNTDSLAYTVSAPKQLMVAWVSLAHSIHTVH